MVIAIDGPAAAGKSTTAKLVASALGFRHVDSGAHYRAATAARLRFGGNPAGWDESDVLAAAVIVTLVPTAAGFEPHLDGSGADAELRGAGVTDAVPRVAQMPRVRDWVNAMVRDAAAGRNVVVDGRDIGTSVFPDAKVKVFLVADPWERARRRLVQRGEEAPGDDAIAAETAALVARDGRDALQSAPAADAVSIDTTHLSQQEQVARIVALAHAAGAPPGTG